MKPHLIVPVLLIAGNPVWAADIRYVPAAKNRPAAIEATDISTALIERPPADWTTVFAVRVGSARTPMLGTFSMSGSTLRFEPRFALVPGLSYRVTFGETEVWLKLPKPLAAATTVVDRVYPTANQLPENQLKFYVHFSAPMSRGEAYSRIRLLTLDGKPVVEPFLELDEELWTPDGTRFTLFLHPGRVKRGLKPREELGPILEEGKRYALAIDARWPDENGNPLKAAFRKEFSVGKPNDRQPDPATWKLHLPDVGSTTPLRVQFPNALDHALLHRMVWISGAKSKLAGRISITNGETVWEFTPATAWLAGEYRLAIDTALEDLSGNSVAKPFEVDVFRHVDLERARIVERKFSIR